MATPPHSRETPQLAVPSAAKSCWSGAAPWSDGRAEPRGALPAELGPGLSSAALWRPAGPPSPARELPRPSQPAPVSPHLIRTVKSSAAHSHSEVQAKTICFPNLGDPRLGYHVLPLVIARWEGELRPSPCPCERGGNGRAWGQRCRPGQAGGAAARQVSSPLRHHRLSLAQRQRFPALFWQESRVILTGKSSSTRGGRNSQPAPGTASRPSMRGARSAPGKHRLRRRRARGDERRWPSGRALHHEPAPGADGRRKPRGQLLLRGQPARPALHGERPLPRPRRLRRARRRKRLRQARRPRAAPGAGLAPVAPSGGGGGGAARGARESRARRGRGRAKLVRSGGPAAAGGPGRARSRRAHAGSGGPGPRRCGGGDKRLHKRLPGRAARSGREFGAALQSGRWLKASSAHSWGRLGIPSPSVAVVFKACLKRSPCLLEWREDTSLRCKG